MYYSHTAAAATTTTTTTTSSSSSSNTSNSSNAKLVHCDTIHSFSILSDDRFKASSKTIPPHSAI